MYSKDLENKPKVFSISTGKYGHGKWLIVFVLLGGIFNMYEQGIKPHSLSSPMIFFIEGIRVILNTGVMYFLTLWIIDLIRRRGKVERPENKKTKLIVNIIFAVIFLMMLVAVVMSISNSPPATNPQQTMQNAGNLQKLSIDFKHLSSEEIVSDISKLSSDEQTTVYKEHSALVTRVAKLWAQNLNGTDFQSAMNKTLPTLISDGWTDGSAKDFITWALSEAYVIDSRNPGNWCKGTNCTALTDKEIKTSLSQKLSENVINGIFQEINVASPFAP